MILVDVDGRIIAANDAATTVLGYSTAQFVRMRSDDLFRASRVVIAAARSSLRQTSRWHGTLYGMRRGGTSIPLDTRISVLRSAAGLRYAVLIRPHRSARPAMPLPLLRAALDQANDAVIITDTALDQPGPQIVYVNAAFCTMTGYSVEEVIGQTPRILQGPATDRAVLDRARAALSQGRPFEGELINYRKDGSTYELEWRIAPVRDRQGKLTHWISIQQDITKRKQAAAERERLYQETQAALQVRDQLLTMVSHELKTPLTSMMGYSYLLQRIQPDDPHYSERTEQGLKVIMQQTQRLNLLIERLLDVERIQSGALSLNREPVDLADLARQVITELQPLQELHTLMLSAPDTPQMISGDELRLRHVLQQLIQNAVTYSPAGGLVRVEIEPQPEQICLRVIDQGIGVPDSARAQIFQRFYRAGNVNPTQISGFGVGLYIVQAIVEQHGGTIAVSSNQGAGSTFTICLPYA